ncbi:amidohydrolase family protein, partial [Corallococcus exiguus]|uniref:amidohydrolase family protein n=1 Tax=Corallococcus exiguus TaxID=83462 RepID=UPI00147355B7
GNLIDEPTARVMVEHGAFVVPTLVTYDSLRRNGADYGMSRVSLDKNDRVLDAGKRSLEIYRSAGVKMGFGTDLIGVMQKDQSLEFLIRAEVLSPQEIIRSATLVNAEILRRERLLGEIVPGSHADLLVVDGDPYRDLSVLQNEGARIPAIMLGGRFIKNEL